MYVKCVKLYGFHLIPQVSFPSSVNLQLPCLHLLA